MVVLCTFAIAAACVVAIMGMYTPTVTLRIENDTARQVTLSGCASNPATLNHGQTVTVDPNTNDPHAACVVYLGETRQVMGCLYIPTTRYHNGATVRLSLYKRGVAPTSC